MDPNTVNLITFIEGLVALTVKSIAELKSVVTGANTKAVDEILADADAEYQKVIANAQKK